MCSCSLALPCIFVTEILCSKSKVAGAHCAPLLSRRGFAIIYNGIIIKGIGGFYYIETENGIYECKAKGIFRKNNITPTVGDNVTISVIDDENKLGNLDKIHDRKNLLIRPAIANVDNFFIVSSVKSPDFDPYFVDKLTVICEYNNIEPIIILNKTDLAVGNEIGEIYEKVGYKVIYTSAIDSENAADIKKHITKPISIFSGLSGVGKSSLLNLIIDGLELKTGEVSKITRGRHTTRHSELFKIADDVYVADTPGFSSFEIDFQIENLGFLFPEFRECECKFVGCSHTKEKGCGVLEGLNNGEISPSRHDSYVKIYNSVKDIKHWM